MSAAFNLVAKSIIIPKLRRIGFGVFAAKLLENYLTGRRSVTKVSGVWSTAIQVLTGIGEGSVLGPLVFILTIVCVSMGLIRVKTILQEQHAITAKMDDAFYDKQVSLSSTEFADDCTGVAVADTEQQLSVALNVMAAEYKRYFQANGLRINVLKSEHIVLGKNQPMNILVEGGAEAKKVKLLQRGEDMCPKTGPAPTIKVSVTSGSGQESSCKNYQGPLRVPLN